ncbi:signal peptidase II [Candidatus Peribacteria bacterium RIFOXYC2_FULL_55_14]|nr:MAG: Lipoprotein signal peptidase [Candidatus Peribacteria bacterium GW2011_GWC2_54_8]KKW44519.1 MAG: Lipoprotein signal peptidase [Candidatus Peregrinibacteria bacterium GW2011_GWA2_54_9]OGJ72416.1 MAG: signal peptidase II [Candidatus Peribacteria bacterium RIFOXYA1_FULL_56_14]OGJ73465.1 MAG: signal peptidase II [Candidatus Peribacteria bacterium RIFOXYA2_FULL_55_28]OGJ74646.1 MAG: signal peptidase II [Candidatus Peribacteria bacterium RIFOXYB1_FULL_54_35]OGJ76812.1 MAG: signal peptidase I
MQLFWGSFILSFLGSIGSAVLTERFLHERVALIGSFVGLQKSMNTGVAFGLELGLAEPILIAVAAVAVAVMALRTARSAESQVGFGLLLGGGLANIVDRLHNGTVTDLFQIGRFPIFNVADSCITVGVSLLFAELIFQKFRARKRC